MTETETGLDAVVDEARGRRWRARGAPFGRNIKMSCLETCCWDRCGDGRGMIGRDAIMLWSVISRNSQIPRWALAPCAPVLPCSRTYALEPWNLGGGGASRKSRDSHNTNNAGALLSSSTANPDVRFLLQLPEDRILQKRELSFCIYRVQGGNGSGIKASK